MRERCPRTETTVESAPRNATPARALVGRADAPPRPSRTTGLFHLACSSPRGPSWRAAVHRVTGAGPFTGASDHLVSEALYLDDPEGNGIEIYRDRPREEWTYVDGSSRWRRSRSTSGVLASVAAGTGTGMAPDTRIGHVHLQVADIRGAEAFYVDALGFEPTARLSGRAVRLGGRLPPPSSGSTRGRAGEHRHRRLPPAGCAGSRSCSRRGCARSTVARPRRGSGRSRTTTVVRRHGSVGEPSRLSRLMRASSATAARACRSYSFAA